MHEGFLTGGTGGRPILPDHPVIERQESCSLPLTAALRSGSSNRRVGPIAAVAGRQWNPKRVALQAADHVGRGVGLVSTVFIPSGRPHLT
jgi:hypothetical protein